MKNRPMAVNVYFCLVVGLSGAVYASFYAVADGVALHLGQQTGAIGRFASLYAAGSLCGTLVAGAIADSVGKPRVVRSALLVLAGGSALLSLPLPAFFSMLGIFCLGMGAGCCEIQSSAILAERDPGRSTLWMNVSQCLFCLGAIGAPLVAAWYSERSQNGYRGIFLLVGLLTGLFICAFHLLRAGGATIHSQAAARVPGRSLLGVLRKPRFVLICSMVFLYVGYESVSVAFLKPFFMAHGLGAGAAAAAISVFWLCMICARLAGALLGGREPVSIMGFGLVTLAGIALLLWAKQAALLYAGAALLGAGCGPVWPMLFSLGGRQHPGQGGAAFAVMSLFSAGGGIVFPTLIGSWPGSLPITFALTGALVFALLLLGFAQIWIPEKTAKLPHSNGKP